MSIEQLDKIIVAVIFLWMLSFTLFGMFMFLLVKQPLDEIQWVLKKIMEKNSGHYRS